MRASTVLATIVLLDALVMAFGHAPLALFIGYMIRPPPIRPPTNATGTRGLGSSAGAAFPFTAIGAYFLITTVLYLLAGILVASGKLFKLANLGLIILAIVDNSLLIYTRTMPNIFFQRTIPWSWGWFPLGTLQILTGQTIIIVSCAALLYEARSHEADSPRAQ